MARAKEETRQFSRVSSECLARFASSRLRDVLDPAENRRRNIRRVVKEEKKKKKSGESPFFAHFSSKDNVETLRTFRESHERQ